MKATTKAKTSRRRRPRCTIGVKCRRHYDQVHGLEAEELRHGIERLISEAGEDFDRGELAVGVKDLQRLLDTTDARDSLAFREARDARR